MDLNNSASANVSDKLLSILEWGKGSSILRDQLHQFLHNHIESLKLNKTTIPYDRNTLRKCLSIKEAIAYTTGIIYAREWEKLILPKIKASKTNNVDDVRIRKNLDNLIATIEKNLMNNQDFSESRVLRHAALNRFQCKLSLSETHKLNEFSIKVREVCRTNGLDNLAESTDFTHESDAQKILKVSDALLQMSANGVSLDSKLLTEFEVFNEKIKPIRDLDKHYKHVTKTLNMLHRIAQKWYHSMVTPNQKDKVNKVLKTLDMTAEVNEAMVKFNDINNFEKNEEHGGLDRIIAKVQSKAWFRETITKLGISEGQFNSRFYSLYAFVLTQNAKTGLDLQKGVVFGEELAHFEADTQSRRGMVRRKVFDIADRMVGNPATFAPNDFNTANSYFEKFRDLFFAKEEDNYGKGDKKLHYDKMTQVVSALVRQRVGLSISWDRIRKWSAGRKIYHWIESALSGKERGIKERIKRKRHSADDADVVAMVIMAQNEASNEIFYQDKNKNKKGDNRWGKLRHKVETAELGRQAVREKITPAVNKTLTLAEETIKKWLKLTAGLTKTANRVGSRATKWLSYAAGWLTGKFNTMIKDGGYKRWKTPLYLAYPLTSMVEWWSKLTYKWATYMQKKWGEHIDSISRATKEGYAGALDLVSKGTGKETDYLFQWLTYATDQATGLLGNTISGAGKLMHDNYATGQKRSILGAFYAAAKEQKGLEDLMQSAELGEMLNLKARWPKLFDEDGRILTTEKVEKKDESSPEVAGKLFGEALEKQYKTLMEQTEADIKKREKEYEDAISKTDENQKIQANTKLQNAQLMRNDISTLSTEMDKLINIIKKPIAAGVGGAAPTRRTADMTANIGALKWLTNPIILGIDINAINVECSLAFKNLNQYSSKVNWHEDTIKSLNYALQQRWADIALINWQITAEKRALDRTITGKSKAIEEYNKKQVELFEAQQRKWIFQRIEQSLDRIDWINIRMGAAATDEEKKEIAKELAKYGKDINILLHPEESKNKKIIDIGPLSQEKQDEISKIFNAAA